MDIAELKSKSIADLHQMAEELSIHNYSGLRKQDLIFRIEQNGERFYREMASRLEDEEVGEMATRRPDQADVQTVRALRLVGIETVLRHLPGGQQFHPASFVTSSTTSAVCGSGEA